MIYKGKAVGTGPEVCQFSEQGDKGTLQIVLDLNLKVSDTETRRVQTFLFFSKDSMSYSFERLIKLGWKAGKAAKTNGELIQALGNLDGITDNEVEIDERTEEYQGKSRKKYEIVSGGRVVVEKPVEKNAFLARLGAIANEQVGAGGGNASGGGNVPF